MTDPRPALFSPHLAITDWNRYTIPQMVTSLDADDDLNDRQTLAWRRMNTLLTHHAEVLTRAAAELAHQWPPEVSPAAKAFQERVKALAAMVTNAATIAGDNMVAITMLTNAMNEARGELTRLASIQQEVKRDIGMNPLQQSIAEQIDGDIHRRARITMGGADQIFALSHASLRSIAGEYERGLTPISPPDGDSAGAKIHLPTIQPGSGHRESPDAAGDGSWNPSSGQSHWSIGQPVASMSHRDGPTSGNGLASPSGLASGPHRPELPSGVPNDHVVVGPATSGAPGLPGASPVTAFGPIRTPEGARGSLPNSTETGRSIGRPDNPIRGSGASATPVPGVIGSRHRQLEHGALPHGASGSGVSTSGVPTGGVIGGRPSSMTASRPARSPRTIGIEDGTGSRPHVVPAVIEADPEPDWTDPGPNIIGINR